MTTITKNRPILFRSEMVRAIIEGRKTQTRRLVKPQPYAVVHDVPKPGMERAVANLAEVGCRMIVAQSPCPYGAVGDRLWVRETWRCHGGREYEYLKEPGAIRYRADADAVDYVQAEWRPSIFMPRWACRLELEIVKIRVARLMDITTEDAKAEGIPKPADCEDCGPGIVCWRDAFIGRFQTMHKKPNGWNPLLWVLDFKRIK